MFYCYIDDHCVLEYGSMAQGVAIEASMRRHLFRTRQLRGPVVSWRTYEDLHLIAAAVAADVRRWLTSSELEGFK